ncbi:hypothetical protein HYPSUDRAFT_977537 [Hypholoma sublateritium FD-334 SS-4]|uniref:NACHT domain-containing protein n=1 Tax=Hypholoma sublateritium (strain FD-334 SS-4) TaxID=945553 RepID=A0A0D2KTJ8_HYPSF|nr:hypothetical protein HYPSUDRAFT_977537 [Hypholoma sublateritium FD-334 SS-4]
MQKSGGFLGKKNFISGGQFIQHNISNHYYISKGGLENLMSRVATSAFHNSSQRVDPPRCHEHTRKAVLDEIFNWIITETSRTSKILWLNGAAGAGKTAIAQSIAELCIVRSILVASFFFFRADGKRNTIDLLVTTLVYQLVQLVPETKGIIEHAIESNPLIFEQSLDTQLEELLLKPLLRVRLTGHVSTARSKMLLIIDGLDECEDEESQASLLHLIFKVIRNQDCPFIIIIASRAEMHIKMAFNSLKAAEILLRIPLDDNYLADQDIHIFVADKFAEIKQTHPYNYLLDSDWPPPALSLEIVRKASGQFIYASAAMKFISLPRSHPARQLEILHGLRTPDLATPFAQLDMLYRQIFSMVQDLDLVFSILAYSILRKRSTISFIAHFYNIPEVDIRLALVDLSSVINCEKGTIRFLHASLPDFLLDKTRSQQYHLCIRTWSTRLAISWLTNVSVGIFSGTDSLFDFLAQSECTPALRERIISFHPDQLSYMGGTSFFSEYLSVIQKLDFFDDGECYRHQVGVVDRFMRSIHSSQLAALGTGNNISESSVEKDYDKGWQ